MNLTITVTAADIENGLPMYCGKCPIALAVKRAAGEWNVNVAQDDIQIYHHQLGQRAAKTSRRARRFVRRFDSGKNVEPFTFRASFREVDGAAA